MGETIDSFKALRLERQKQKSINLKNAVHGIDITTFETAKNLRIVRHSEYHYRIEHEELGWMLDIWPSTQRLRSVGKVRAPFLPVERPWTLKDIFEAANTYELQRQIPVQKS
jgi:hypothetical protein